MISGVGEFMKISWTWIPSGTIKTGIESALATGPPGRNSEETPADFQGSNSLFIVLVNDEWRYIEGVREKLPVGEHETGAIWDIPASKFGVVSIFAERECCVREIEGALLLVVVCCDCSGNKSFVHALRGSTVRCVRKREGLGRVSTNVCQNPKASLHSIHCHWRPARTVGSSVV
jgi:hypothetical protein